MNSLNDMKSAPKDKQILIDSGLGFLQVAHWNAVEECWVYASLNCNDVDGNDIFFENEYEKSPVGWIPLPSYTPQGCVLRKNIEDAIKCKS